jgi:hypothetical protein
MFIKRKILITLLALNAIVLSIFLYFVMNASTNVPAPSVSTSSLMSRDSQNAIINSRVQEIQKERDELEKNNKDLEEFYSKRIGISPSIILDKKNNITFGIPEGFLLKLNVGDYARFKDQNLFSVSLYSERYTSYISIEEEPEFVFRTNIVPNPEDAFGFHLDTLEGVDINRGLYGDAGCLANIVVLPLENTYYTFVLSECVAETETDRMYDVFDTTLFEDMIRGVIRSKE